MASGIVKLRSRARRCKVARRLRLEPLAAGHTTPVAFGDDGGPGGGLVLVPRRRSGEVVMVWLWYRWCGDRHGPPRLRLALPGRGGSLTVPAAGASYPGCGSGPRAFEVDPARRPFPRSFHVGPRHGGTRTTFRVHYVSAGKSATSAERELLYLRGPANTPCDRLLLRRQVGTSAGLQTILLGPGVHAAARPIPRRYGFPTGQLGGASWCPGLYRGVIQDESDYPTFVFGRFFFRVR